MTQLNLQLLDGNLALQPISALPDVDGSFRLTRTGEHRNPTFRYAGNIALAATPTDVLVIQGSATRTLRIKQMRFHGASATAAGTMQVIIQRRTTANSGGTPVAVVGSPHDVANDGSPTGVVNKYTANPASLGTVGSGLLGQARLFFGIATTTQVDRLDFQYADNGDKPIILRGVLDFVAINLAGGAVPTSGSLDFDIEIEEDQS